jgi:hypothetical protein
MTQFVLYNAGFCKVRIEPWESEVIGLNEGFLTGQFFPLRAQSIENLKAIKMV